MINFQGNMSYSQTVQGANRNINISVTDGTNPIPNASIWAYSPSGNITGASSHTDLTGNATLHLKDGAYTIGASVDGLPPIPEKSLTVSGT